MPDSQAIPPAAATSNGVRTAVNGGGHVVLSTQTIVLGALGAIALFYLPQFLSSPQRLDKLETAVSGISSQFEKAEEARKSSEARLTGIETQLARIPDQFAALASSQARADLAIRDVQQAVTAATTTLTAVQAAMPDLARRVDRLSQLMTEFRQALIKQNGSATGPSLDSEEGLPPLGVRPQRFKPAAMWCPCDERTIQRWWG